MTAKNARTSPASTGQQIASAKHSPAPGESTAPVLSVDDQVLAALRALSGPQEPNALAEVIDLFLSSTAVLLDSMANSVRKKDGRSLEAAAHSLKGSAGNLGANIVVSLCSALLEHAAHSDFTAASALIEPLRTEFECVKQILEKEKDRTSSEDGPGR